MLDAIIEPEWQGRYYSFNAHWADGEMMASMRDGSGDDYFILFNSAGAIILGFAHESTMASFVEGGRPHWPGLLDQVPQAFAGALAEPAFETGATSFCIWRQHDASSWSIGNITFPPIEEERYRHLDGVMREVVESWARDHDGSAHLLFMLDGDPQTYQTWVEEYYEHEVPLDAVERIYRHEPLTRDLIAALNAEVTLAMLHEDCREIGYPIAEGEEG